MTAASPLLETFAFKQGFVSFVSNVCRYFFDMFLKEYMIFIACV